MAGAGWRSFPALSTLTSAQVQTYLQDQTVQVYANAAARSSALGTSVSQGMVSFDKSVNERHIYDGSNWVKEAPAVNAVANGDFSKWSRGTSFSATNSGNYFADRWKAGYHDATPTTASVTQQAFTPGTAPVAGYESAFFIRSTITTVGSTTIYRPYQQNIEDVRTLAGQVATLSFWAKSDSARTQTVNIVQNFGSGGSADAPATTIPNTGNGYSFSTTTSWQRFSFYFQPQSIAGKTIGAGSYLYTFIQQAAASGSVLDLWGVQLEVGSVASPFRPAGGNSALDTATAGSAGFDGVLVSTNSASNPSGSGTPAWAGFDVAGKNKIINGGFDFWQRGTSFTNPSSFAYTADRWTQGWDGSGATRTISQQTFTPGTAPVAGYEGTYFYRFNQSVAGSGGTFNVLQYRVEDARTLAGQPVTLSFWAKANSSFTLPYIQPYQVFGAGGSANQYAANNNSIAITTSWQRFTWTFNVPSLSGKTIGTNNFLALEFGLPLNSAFTFDIWGVQLEAGSVATPFSRAGGTLQGEKAACQRYYWRATALGSNDGILPTGTALSSTQVIIHGFHPTSMRTYTSSFDFSNIRLFDGVTVFAVTAVTSSFTNPDTYALILTCAGGLTQYRPYVVLANAGTSYFGANAEL